ncbi:hypothetical protein SEA_SLEEPYHEAD_37 [Rhodococcus phage Sleepyhead]|uniref:Uncharacterized protein n=1 Tax=Rhodococcus phage Sleepyhead TaxID=2591131 RepID=A0A515MHA1_9CAUD|nr:hypothetical protein HWC38_gp37 [Rhodococcus phage Sleepyhead]QDM56052.1 hypothetical protein SEA_SLEEPYHEAD_37 [Rhodococcus phage Sleepyhead]
MLGPVPTQSRLSDENAENGATSANPETGSELQRSTRPMSRSWVAKILDIFEGTQQIQQLIVARRLLGKSSAELK